MTFKLPGGGGGGGGGGGAEPVIVTFAVAQGFGDTFVTHTMAEYGPALE